MRSHRRQAVVLVLVLGVVALVAQLAGVGGTRTERAASKPKEVALATIPNGAVADRGSTKLASTRVRAGKGETVRMTGTAKLRSVTAARKKGVTQVVCGIRYSRDGDRAWTVGDPYETVVLKKAGARDGVTIARSFQAPAGDTYRMSMACHVSSPAKGAKVTATGTMVASLGLPQGAATPVD